jgi:hypothetical protein
MTRSQPPLFDATVRIDRLPASGREIKVSLDEEQRAALAEALKISAVERFEAVVSVAPFRGGIRALGNLEARIVQPSVVTFEPVTQDISEPIDRIFLPDAPSSKPAPGSEVFVDLEDDDFPDQLDGPEVDLSVLMTEVLALAIDPYPRLPDEHLEQQVGDAEPERANPFAALAKLRDPPKE